MMNEIVKMDEEIVENRIRWRKTDKVVKNE